MTVNLSDLKFSELKLPTTGTYAMANTSRQRATILPLGLARRGKTETSFRRNESFIKGGGNSLESIWLHIIAKF